MSKGDNFGMVVGSLIGSTSLGVSSFFGYLSADTLSEQLTSGAGVDDFGASTSEAGNELHDISDGNYGALTTVFGLLTTFSGSSTAGPDLVIEVFSHNAKPYNLIEKKAKQVYDKYDTEHEKTKDEGVSLVTTDPTVATLVNDIVSSANSKEEILANLAALESVLSYSENSEESTKEEAKVIKKTYGKN